jgi:hypothetical protein
MPAWSSLPDAPTPVKPQTQAESFHAFVNEARSPLTFPQHLPLRLPQPSSISLFQPAPVQKETGTATLLGKLLHPQLPKQDQPHFSSTGGLVARTCFAASRVLITRDDSGKSRLNTSYFLGVLTSSVVHSAYRPYWARSTSATFNDFGSTIGGNAGVNVFHEFEPGLRQVMNGHVPKIVSRIEERITHDHTHWDAGSGSAR